MERTVLRILGKKGRTTIPWPIRAELDFCPGDVLLFEPLIGDIFTEEFHRLPLSQQYRLLASLLADFHLQ